MSLTEKSFLSSCIPLYCINDTLRLETTILSHSIRLSIFCPDSFHNRMTMIHEKLSDWPRKHHSRPKKLQQSNPAHNVTTTSQEHAYLVPKRPAPPNLHFWHKHATPHALLNPSQSRVTIPKSTKKPLVKSRTVEKLPDPISPYSKIETPSF